MQDLKQIRDDQSDAALWFDSPTSTTPIASGIQANTNKIPSDKTYYLGLNEMTGSIGPKNKKAFSSGGYNYFQGNFVKFHNDVPLTIATSRLYVGAGGKVNFIVADLADYDSCTGAFSYFPISSNTINVYPTTPNPSRVASEYQFIPGYRCGILIGSARTHTRRPRADCTCGGQRIFIPKQ